MYLYHQDEAEKLPKCPPPSSSLFNQWFRLRGPRRLGGVDISPNPRRKRVDEEVAVGVVIKILLFIL